jgi:hypothetical protein
MLVGEVMEAEVTEAVAIPEVVTLVADT